MLFSSSAFAALAIFVASCGSAMTEEQIQAEAQKKFDAEKTALEEQAKADCDGKSDDYKKIHLDSIMEANMPAEEATEAAK